METALYASPDILRSFLSLVDLFLVDLKIYDPGSHRRGTGVDNRLILDNFILVARGKPACVQVRVPLIPGFTADGDNLAAVARFVRDVDDRIPIELINYNPLAANKYKNMGIPYAVPADARPFPEEEMRAMYDIIRRTGAAVYGARPPDADPSPRDDASPRDRTSPGA
jgi:pyruvate formate lyase activating enzyme